MIWQINLSNQTCIHPCIQPSFATYHSQVLTYLGGPQGITRPEKIQNLSSDIWVFPGVSYKWDKLGTPLKRGILEAFKIDAQTRTPFSAKQQWLYSELPDLAPLFLRLSLAPPQKVLILAAQSHSFVHDPYLTIIDEGWTVNTPVNWRLRLSAQLFLYHDRPQ